jgi:hypothetical protein
MQILRHAHEVSAFVQLKPESEIAVLIQRRLDELLSEGDTTMEELVFFVIPESRDAVTDLETTLGNSIRTTEGHPLWEVIEAHNTCYEMVFVLSSSGYGALVFVPYTDAHPELLAMCRAHVARMHVPSAS